MAIIINTTSAANINLQFREVESLIKKNKKKPQNASILYRVLYKRSYGNHTDTTSKENSGILHCLKFLFQSDASIVNQNLH